MPLRVVAARDRGDAGGAPRARRLERRYWRGGGLAPVGIGDGVLDPLPPAYDRPFSDDKTTAERTFVPLPLDKHDWHRSPLPGQIVLVTTIDTDQTLDVAAKSWVSMAAFNGPIIGFGCNESHQTSRNRG